MKFIYFVVWLVFFVWLIYKLKFFRHADLKFKHLIFLFLVKIVASFLVYGVYTKFYNERINADIFKYYDDGIILYNSLSENPIHYLKMLTGIDANHPQLMKYYNQMSFWIKPYNFEIINENKTLIRLNAFISLFSFHNYFIHVLVFVFLSFVGLFAIFKVLSQYLQHYPFLLAFVIFLFPSTLFWSSAILKEALVFFSLGLSLYYFIDWYNYQNKFSALKFLFFLIILMISKMYIFLIVLPSLSYLFITRFIPKLNKLLFFVAFHIICILFFFYSEWILPYNFSEIVTIKQHHFIKMASEFNAGSQIFLPALEDNLLSFISLVPVAIVNSFFRPFIWEAHNILALVAAIENIILFVMFIFAIVFFRTTYSNPMFLFSISFILLLFMLIGISTPVLGALVRYKAPALPFLLFLLLLFTNIDKVLNKLKYVWKKLYS